LLRKNRCCTGYNIYWKGGAAWVRVTKEAKKVKYAGTPMAKYAPRKNRKKKRNNHYLSHLLFIKINPVCQPNFLDLKRIALFIFLTCYGSWYKSKGAGFLRISPGKCKECYGYG
jgi:hypothetical protein